MTSRVELFSPSASFSLPAKAMWPLIVLVAMVCGFVGVDSYVRFSGWGLTPVWYALVLAIVFAIYGAHSIDNRMKEKH